MTRLKILAEAAGTDEKTITDNSDIYWITPEQALEAMKRFGEFCYNGAILEKDIEEEWVGEIKARDFETWLKEQEETK